MSILPRRQIDEIISLHEMEPSLREVIVEGVSDKHLFEWFLGESCAASAAVLDVGSIDVPAELVLQKGLPDGERSRVIVVAEMLAADGPARDQVTCIIDADFDLLLDTPRVCPALLSTDFAALEGYAFNIQTMEKIRKLALKGFQKSAATILEQLAGPLQELFLLRALNELEGLGLDFKTPNSSGFYQSLRLTASRFELDLGKYVTSILQHRGIVSKKAEVLEKVAELRGKLKTDPRLQINGHDFRHAFCLYVRQHKGFGNRDGELAAGALMSALDLKILAEHKLFRQLVQRIGKGGWPALTVTLQN